MPTRRIWRSTTLGRALLANMILIGALAALAMLLALAFFIRESFGQLETEEMRGHQNRAEAYLQTTLTNLGKRSKDWGLWDDTFQYLRDFNGSYEASNINAESFRNALTDGMVLVRFDDRARRSFAFDPGSEAANPAFAAKLLAVATAPQYRQMAQSRPDSQSFILIDGRLFAIASIQVRRSDLTGTPEGYLVFIQHIDTDMVHEALQLPVTIDMAGRTPEQSVATIAKKIRIAVPARSIDGKPVAVLHFMVERKLMAAGEHLLVLVIGAGLLLMIILIFALNRRITALVIAPVERLQRHVAEIRSTGELRPVESETRDDELGALQGEFNAMAAELQVLRSENEAQSFALGRSQNAIGAMHNVRNSLSPVHVILSTLDQKLGEGVPAQSERALRELADPATADARRERLIAYLGAVHARVDEMLADARSSTREAGRNLNAALEAIAQSQDKGSAPNAGEACELAGMISRAANLARYRSGAAIALDLDCPARIVASGNRVLLSQVIENLVANAVEAIVASGRDEGSLTITAANAPEAGRCTISVSDDGEGFDEQTGARLFERGFSRRAEKHGGLGLHWCANTVNAMGGRLHLTSPGPGRGAVAVLDLRLWDDAAGKAAA